MDTMENITDKELLKRAFNIRWLVRASKLSKQIYMICEPSSNESREGDENSFLYFEKPFPIDLPLEIWRNEKMCQLTGAISSLRKIPKLKNIANIFTFHKLDAKNLQSPLHQNYYDVKLENVLKQIPEKFLSRAIGYELVDYSILAPQQNAQDNTFSICTKLYALDHDKISTTIKHDVVLYKDKTFMQQNLENL